MFIMQAPECHILSEIYSYKWIILELLAEIKNVSSVKDHLDPKVRYWQRYLIYDLTTH